MSQIPDTGMAGKIPFDFQAYTKNKYVVAKKDSLNIPISKINDKKYIEEQKTKLGCERKDGKIRRDSLVKKDLEFYRGWLSDFVKQTKKGLDSDNVKSSVSFEVHSGNVIYSDPLFWGALRNFLYLITQKGYRYTKKIEELGRDYDSYTERHTYSIFAR